MTLAPVRAYGQYPNFMDISYNAPGLRKVSFVESYDVSPSVET